MVTTDNEKLQESFAVVGELVLFATTLDYLLNRVMVEVLSLGTNPMLMPVIATLDPVRKVEILKQWAVHIKSASWKKGIRTFTDKSEEVFKYRNIACHSTPVFDDGEWFLTGLSAAKRLKGLKPDGRLDKVSLSDLRHGIEAGHVAFKAGEALIENYKRFNAELQRRASEKKE